MQSFCRVGRWGPGSVSVGRLVDSRRPLIFCGLPKKMGQLNDDEEEVDWQSE